LEEKERVGLLVPDIFQPLIKYHSRKVDFAMTPGLNQLTWTSLNVGAFLKKVESAIAQFERLTKQVRGLPMPMGCSFHGVL
jgi:dynein heavy chain